MDCGVELNDTLNGQYIMRFCGNPIKGLLSLTFRYRDNYLLNEGPGENGRVKGLFINYLGLNLRRMLEMSPLFV